MCSIVEEDFGDDGGAHAMIEENQRDEINNSICKKCGEKQSLAKMMCSDCFCSVIRHKFRASLGSTKIVKRNSTVLLNFTGSVESTCLAEMINFAFEQESYKRLTFELLLVYVDYGSCLAQSANDPKWRLEKIQEIRKLLDQFPKFKCYYSSIAVASEESNELKLLDEITIEDIKTLNDKEAEFVQKFKALYSVTSQQSFLSETTSSSLRSSAKILNCQYVFLSETSIDLAHKLITNISLGRGSSVAHDVAFCDDRTPEVKFVRPLKDLSSDDTSIFAKFLSLKYLEPESSLLYGENLDQFASIQNLTAKFINDLQKNFPSTVSTIYRTCSKIAPNKKDSLEIQNTSDDRCIMCKSFLDQQNSETLFAINFSSRVSNAIDNNLLKDTAIKQPMCQGCLNIFSF